MRDRDGGRTGQRRWVRKEEEVREREEGERVEWVRGETALRKYPHRVKV